MVAHHLSLRSDKHTNIRYLMWASPSTPLLRSNSPLAYVLSSAPSVGFERVMSKWEENDKNTRKRRGRGGGERKEKQVSYTGKGRRPVYVVRVLDRRQRTSVVVTTYVSESARLRGRG